MLDPIALGAFEGGESVGFVAAAGRAANIGELYLASFLAVRPGTTSMLAVSLQRQHIRAIVQRLGKPLLAFTHLGSAGDHLLRSCNLSGVRRIPLGEYRVHAAVPRKDFSGVRIEQVSPEEWARAAKTFEDESLLSPKFNAATIHHFAKDPAGRQFLVAMDGSTVAGIAMRAIAPTVTAKGVENFPVLHYIRLLDGHAEGLKALLWHAKDPAIPIVTVSNTVRIEPATAKAAGLRSTGSVFTSYLFSTDERMPLFPGTEFEIV